MSRISSTFTDKRRLEGCYCSAPYLFPIVGDRGQDSTQILHTDGYVQQVTGIEEVVIMSKQGHDRVPT